MCVVFFCDISGLIANVKLRSYLRENAIYCFIQRQRISPIEDLHLFLKYTFFRGLMSGKL